MEVGQHYSQVVSFYNLRLVLSAPPSTPPMLIHFLEDSEGLAAHAQTIWHRRSTEVYIKGVCQVFYKTSQLSPLLSFSSLSLSYSLCGPQIWTIHASGPTQDLKTGDLFSSLSLFYALIFSPLLPHLHKVRLSYSAPYSVLKFLVRFEGLSVMWRIQHQVVILGLIFIFVYMHRHKRKVLVSIPEIRKLRDNNDINYALLNRHYSDLPQFPSSSLIFLPQH